MSLRNLTIGMGRTYFIADIAANHDGSLDRALQLIELAADAGADAAKFQNFRAETIVSSKGFQELGKKLTHQASWEKDVVEVYRDASIPLEWTDLLHEKCEHHKIDYFTSPYDLDYISYFSKKIPYFKIGSGDITWQEAIEKIASYGKPVLLATGASTEAEVRNAMHILEKSNCEIVLMQCNTNYTASIDNFRFLNLNVLESFANEYPNAILGLSDHTEGAVAVLGAVAKGARVIEKHFTDDKTRKGPDHGFSMNPMDWRQMVSDVRKLELALGTGVKIVEENEIDARIVQRRALRYRQGIGAGHIILSEDLIALRPCPADGINPFETSSIIGRALTRSVNADDLVRHSDFA
jgi:N-acetylneuraminate synthase